MAYYFDYAAATPMLPEVVAAMQPYLTDIFYNPSALYLAAKAVKKDLQAARHVVAQQFGAKSSELLFTAGGTEANNIAICGVMNQWPDAHIVTSAIEHESVVLPAQQFQHTIVPADHHGRVVPHEVETAITDKTVLVSVMLANNEIGTIQDIPALAEIVARLRRIRQEQKNTHPLYLHTDACQAVNYLDIHTARLGVDMLTVNAGKIYGPKQTGALYIKSGVVLTPFIRGGGQERSIRSGTENVANYIGFAKAIQIVRSSATEEVHRLTELRDYIIDALVTDDKISLNGAKSKHRLANNVHITIHGTDNERFLMELDERGVQVATGSACSASNDEPSHVLAAIGLDEQQIRSSLRITLGRHTTKEHCDVLIKSIKELVAKQ